LGFIQKAAVQDDAVGLNAVGPEEVMTENPFEIPQHMRDLAEQNMKQAHAAYAQLMDFVTKTMDAWMGAMPANPMTAGLKDVQGRATEFAKENAEAMFTLSSKISSTQNLQEILTLQMQFAQDRMQAFVTQTQQLFTLIEKAIQKSESGATGAGMGATPSSPIVTGLKDVQDRAVAMKKQNAESASGLVEKIGKAQTLQDVFRSAEPATTEAPTQRGVEPTTATPELSPRQSAVLEALRSKMDEHKQVAAKAADLAKAAQTPLGSLRSVLQSLEKKQLIKTIRAGSARAPAVYEIL
jgi:hypothetical protein